MTTQKGNTVRGFLVGLALFVAVVATYWPVRHFEFVDHDDDGYVSENPQVAQGLTAAGVKWAFTTGAMANWHPVTWLSYMLDVEVFGIDAGGHHLVNVLLHAALAVLVFLVFWNMTGGFWPSAFVAALFALHPLHVESVAWISERKDVLSGIFWMLTMLAYAHYAASPRLTRYTVVLLTFSLGLMAKPMLVSLPLILLLLDYWPLARVGEPFRFKAHSRLIVEKIPLFLLAGASCGVTYLVQRHGGAVGGFEPYGIGVRLGNAAVSYVAYGVKMVWPFQLAVLYPHQGAAMPWWKPACSVLVLLIITGLAIRAARRKPYLLTGWFWYLAALIPVIGIVQVGVQAMADRYTYLPLIGLFVIVAWGGGGLAPRVAHRKPMLAAVSLALLIALALVTRNQVGYWRDSTTLFTRAVNTTTDNYIAHTNLGKALHEAGRHDDAYNHYREAIRINPRYYLPYFNSANLLRERGNVPGAIDNYHAALQRQPNHVASRYNLGHVMMANGSVEESASHFREALRLDPAHQGARTNLGIALASLGRFDEAIEAFYEALKLNRSHVDALFNLGVTLAKLSRYEEAEKPLAEALALAPDDPEAHYTLGIVLMRLGRQEEAARCFTETLRIDPMHASARQALEEIQRTSTGPS